MCQQLGNRETIAFSTHHHTNCFILIHYFLYCKIILTNFKGFSFIIIIIYVNLLNYLQINKIAMNCVITINYI